MVNVASKIPFNLHSRSMHGLDLSTSRSTRSVSAANALASTSTHPLPNDACSPDALDTTMHISRQPSPTPSMHTSPTRSTTSLQFGYGALDSSIASLARLPSDADLRQPTLNVRLVREPVGVGIGYANGSASVRRGRSRSRGRLGRFGEEREKGKEAERSPRPAGEGEGVAASVGITVEDADHADADADSLAGDEDETPIDAQGRHHYEVSPHAACTPWRLLMGDGTAACIALAPPRRVVPHQKQRRRGHQLGRLVAHLSSCILARYPRLHAGPYSSRLITYMICTLPLSFSAGPLRARHTLSPPYSDYDSPTRIYALMSMLLGFTFTRDSRHRFPLLTAHTTL